MSGFENQYQVSCIVGHMYNACSYMMMIMMQILEKVSPKVSETNYTEATKECNKSKNRYSNHLPSKCVSSTSPHHHPASP